MIYLIHYFLKRYITLTKSYEMAKLYQKKYNKAKRYQLFNVHKFQFDFFKRCKFAHKFIS